MFVEIYQSKILNLIDNHTHTQKKKKKKKKKTKIYLYQFKPYETIGERLWVAYTSISSNDMLVIGKIMESIRENIKHSSNKPKKQNKNKR